MQVNDVLYGFRITRVRQIDELHAALWEMRHEKTGAQLAWLDRRDENKAFSIAFKTLPEDSTGVFHIIEHSVLCGSDKYPVKEPFVELLKSSVQTFLNAFTYPDKTVYPVSSRNDRDFLNLIDVYLDAVLHPQIYRKPEIFRQEGWRYEGEGEGLCYQGVVFNEMKGSFASPQTVLYNAIQRELFPDNCYRHVSGGDPSCIPDLTYEQFIRSHKKYYHPSNARISLVGSIDTDAVLSKIDAFLSAYDRLDADFTIPMQAPIASVTKEVPFAIGAEESETNRAIIASSTLAGTFADRERGFACAVLADYLTGDNDAPLKRAVIDKGLAQEFSVEYEDGVQQPIIGWQAMNTDADKLEALEATVRETLERIVSEGLDKERLSACFRSFAFRLRDRESGGWVPRSLGEGLAMLDTWLYGGDPMDGLTVEAPLNALEQKLEGDAFENLIRELFLDNAHTATIVLVPSKTLGDEKRAAEAARVKAEGAAWTDADRERVKAEAESLKAWQETPDSEEALSTIPMLKRSDLADKPEPLHTERTETGGIPLLRHTLGSELASFKAHFAANDLRVSELPVLSVLCRVLGSMATKRLTRASLPLAVKNTIGKLDFSPTVYPGSDPDHCRVLLSASVTCLKEQAENAAKLLGELLTETVFEDGDLLAEILKQISVGAKISLPQEGHRYAMLRLGSYESAHGVANERLGGVAFMQWLNETIESGESAVYDLLSVMERLLKRLATQKRLTLSCSETVGNEALEALTRMLPKGDDAAQAEAAFPTEGSRHEGIVIPAQVGFAVTGGNLARYGLRYSGSIPVLANVLNFTYLWNSIRVQGGAYGCGFVGRDTGDLFFYTYRDPKPARSLGVMREAAAFIRDFTKDDPDLTGFILSAVSAVDPLRTAGEKMAAGDNRYFRGITEDEMIDRYRTLIRTTPKDLEALTEMLVKIAEERVVCVTAGKELLDSCKDEITDVIRV
ncbi:MAG: insulinase family protein [Clostridia bacterium]|nr:insulinase family protein [Clostridia bacterium]